MTLSIRTSLNDLTNEKASDKKASQYSLLLIDTVRVGRNEVVVFTKDCQSELESIEFYFKDDEDEAKAKQEKSKKPGKSAVVTSNIKSTRLRGADRKDNAKDEEEARRREHQKELAAKEAASKASKSTKKPLAQRMVIARRSSNGSNPISETISFLAESKIWSFGSM